MSRIKTIVEEVSEGANECDWCGERYSDNHKHCPHCGILSLDYITYGHEKGWEIEEPNKNEYELN